MPSYLRSIKQGKKQEIPTQVLLLCMIWVLKQMNYFICLFVVSRTAPEWPLANRLSSEWPLRGTDISQNTLRCHRLSQLDNYVPIYVHFYIFKNSWETKIKKNASSIRLPLSQAPFCFVNISAPLNRREMVLYSKFAYGSQFSEEKNDLTILHLVAKILGKNPVSFFWDALYMVTKSKRSPQRKLGSLRNLKLKLIRWRWQPNFFSLRSVYVHVRTSQNARVHVLSRTRAFTALARVCAHESLRKKIWWSRLILWA